MINIRSVVLGLMMLSSLEIYVHAGCSIKVASFPLNVPEGHQWKDTCDICKCTNGKIICSGGPKCSIPHSDTLSYTCLKWSDDKCCCLKQGCVGYDDKEYGFGEWMPMDKTGCEKCQCSEHTLSSKCYIETTGECKGTKHDQPFVSDHLHSHIH